jgi:hypothetical protein
METDLKQTATAKVLRMSEKKRGKLKCTEEEIKIALIRKDALFLYENKKDLIEKFTEFAIEKSKSNGSIIQDLMTLEQRLGEAKLFRYLSLNDYDDRMVILNQLKLPEHVKKWIADNAEIFDVFFHKELKAIQSAADSYYFGYKKRLVNIKYGVYSRFPNIPLLEIILFFEDGHEVNSINDPSGILSAAVKIVESVKSLLALHSKHIMKEEATSLREAFRLLKAEVSLAETYLSDGEKNGQPD